MTSEKFHLGDLDASEQASNQKTFFAPIELKDLTECENQRYKCAPRFALLTYPPADKRCELAVISVVTLGLDLLREGFDAPAVVLYPKRICLERLLQGLVKWTEFVEGCAPLVRRLISLGRSDLFSDSVSRQPGTLR